MIIAPPEPVVIILLPLNERQPISPILPQCSYFFVMTKDPSASAASSKIYMFLSLQIFLI